MIPELLGDFGRILFDLIILQGTIDYIRWTVPQPGLVIARSVITMGLLPDT